MDNKLETTVNKTIEALAKIGRFIDKYGDKLNKNQIEDILQKIKELQRKISE